jgi:hypothetical protein
MEHGCKILFAVVLVAVVFLCVLTYTNMYGDSAPNLQVFDKFNGLFPTHTTLRSDNTTTMKNKTSWPTTTRQLHHKVCKNNAIVQVQTLSCDNSALKPGLYREQLILKSKSGLCLSACPWLVWDAAMHAYVYPRGISPLCEKMKDTTFDRKIKLYNKRYVDTGNVYFLAAGSETGAASKGGYLSDGDLDLGEAMIKKENILNLWPTNTMDHNEKMNSISRIVILLTIIVFFVSKSLKIVLTGCITLSVIIFLHYSANRQKTTKLVKGEPLKRSSGVIQSSYPYKYLDDPSFTWNKHNLCACEYGSQLSICRKSGQGRYYSPWDNQPRFYRPTVNLKEVSLRKTRRFVGDDGPSWWLPLPRSKNIGIPNWKGIANKRDFGYRDILDIDSNKDRRVTIKELLEAAMKKKVKRVWLSVTSFRDPCMWENTKIHLQWVLDISSKVLSGNRQVLFKQEIKPYYWKRYKRQMKLDSFLHDDYVTKMIEDRSTCMKLLCKHSNKQFRFLNKLCEW